LIAGASAGVGAVDADLLARRDHDLIMVERDEARLRSLVERIRETTGWRVEALRADLTRKENLAGIKQTPRGDPSIGLLVINAGIAAGRTLPDNEPDNLEVMV
jgi:short-subunit dehydrogenase